MQVVIDIPDELYEVYQKDSSLSMLNKYQQEMAQDYLVASLINGVPLSKGHGRLIDADAYIENNGAFGWLNVISVNGFESITPTIIEADKTRKFMATKPTTIYKN